MPELGNPWIRHLRRSPTATSTGITSASASRQLVCFPFAGGSAAYYEWIASGLELDINVLAVQYPGRHDRFGDQLITSVQELADQAAAALLPYLDRPTALFGHSMGASVAFEVALRVERKGAHLQALFASGRSAPTVRRNSRIHQLDRVALVRELINLGATDPAVIADPELLDLVLPSIRADFEAVETYQRTDGQQVCCPVVVLTGSEDVDVTTLDAIAWQHHTTGEFVLHTFPGGHFFIDDHSEQVLKIISHAMPQGAPRPAGPEPSQSRKGRTA